MNATHATISSVLASFKRRALQGTSRLRQLSRAVEQSPVSIVITDTSGVIEYVNPWFEKVTGYTAEEAIGQNPRVLKSGRQPPEFYAELWRTISSGRDWTGEMHNRRKNGELYWERAVISPLRDTRGNVVSYVAVKEDVTAAKQAELDLIAARDEAERANRAKSIFLASMSHELRTPLNVISGLAATLLEQDLPLETRAIVRLMAQGGTTLLGIIEEILVYSKIQAGQEHADDQEVDLAEVVRRSLEVASETARGRPIEVRLHVSPEAPARLRGDQRRLQQVLVNLLANAVKFTERGTVDLVIQAPVDRAGHTCIELAVVDTGTGIRPDVVPMLFQPFQQGDESITRRHGGTGLGLVISRSFMRLMGGDIAVASDYGVGSTFSATMPLREPAGRLASALKLDCGMVGRPVSWANVSRVAAGSEQAPKAQSVLSLGQRLPLRILAADDVATNRQVIRIMFKHLGYMPDIVENGLEVLEALKTRTYDLVLLDLQMPEMDGLTAARAIRKQFLSPEQGPRLVALTANASEEDRLACLSAGMDEFLTKPVVPKQIEACFLRLFRVGAKDAGHGAHAPQEAADDNPWIDRDHIAAICAGLEPQHASEMVLQLAVTFGADFCSTIPRVEEACAARDREAAIAAVHGLKGGAAMLGWARFGAYCGGVLAELRTGRFENWATLAESLREMHHRSAALLDQTLVGESAVPPEPAGVSN